LTKSIFEGLILGSSPKKVLILKGMNDKIFTPVGRWWWGRGGGGGGGGRGDAKV
jgi:NAD(P)H-hydrate repair Nnr-like enzyme with NAD(P)H-hydrate dehydratase domain